MVLLSRLSIARPSKSIAAGQRLVLAVLGPGLRQRLELELGRLAAEAAEVLRIAAISRPSRARPPSVLSCSRAVRSRPASGIACTARSGVPPGPGRLSGRRSSSTTCTTSLASTLRAAASSCSRVHAPATRKAGRSRSPPSAGPCRHRLLHRVRHRVGDAGPQQHRDAVGAGRGRDSSRPARTVRTSRPPDRAAPAGERAHLRLGQGGVEQVAADRADLAEPLHAGAGQGPGGGIAGRVGMGGLDQDLDAPGLHAGTMPAQAMRCKPNGGSGPGFWVQARVPP